MTTHPGIRVRHQAACRTWTDREARCNCSPAFEASVGAGAAGEKVRRSFASLTEAKIWQSEARVAVARGQLRAPSTTGKATIRQAGDALLEGMRNGSVRTRTGDPYKPSVVRGYASNLKHVYEDLGGTQVTKLRRRAVQTVVDGWVADGRDPATVRNMLMPLRVLLRRAIEDGDVAVNPLSNLRLPAARGRRDRIASPAEAAALIAAVRESDRALWATAFYAGLRLGELRALRWSDVDLAAGVIRVSRALDQTGETITPKSAAGTRTVPIAKALRAHLAAHRLSAVGDGYVFGPTLTTPFTPTAVHRRARLKWKTAKLTPIGLHEARHTCASLMIAAGVNAKALTTYLGHASIQTTFDRYGHLMPGNEGEAARLLDAYLEGAGGV